MLVTPLKCDAPVWSEALEHLLGENSAFNTGATTCIYASASVRLRERIPVPP